MKIILLIVCALAILIEVVLPSVFADVIPSGSKQSVKKSNSSLSNPSELYEVPVITNEAEYAEFQKQRELAGHASSSSSEKSNTASSHSNKSKTMAK